MSWCEDENDVTVWMIARSSVLSRTENEMSLRVEIDLRVQASDQAFHRTGDGLEIT